MSPAHLTATHRESPTRAFSSSVVYRRECHDRSHQCLAVKIAVMITGSFVLLNTVKKTLLRPRSGNNCSYPNPAKLINMLYPLLITILYPLLINILYPLLIFINSRYLYLYIVYPLLINILFPLLISSKNIFIMDSD